MPYDVLEKKIKALPESYFEEISNFLDELRIKVIENKKNFDFDKFIIPTERGKNVDSYIQEIRANDRI